jgi:hypothetical protein
MEQIAAGGAGADEHGGGFRARMAVDGGESHPTEHGCSAYRPADYSRTVSKVQEIVYQSLHNEVKKSRTIAFQFSQKLGDWTRLESHNFGLESFAKFEDGSLDDDVAWRRNTGNIKKSGCHFCSRSAKGRRRTRRKLRIKKGRSEENETRRWPVSTRLTEDLGGSFGFFC